MVVASRIALEASSTIRYNIQVHNFFVGIMKRMCFFQQEKKYISSDTREIGRSISMWLLHSEVSLLVLDYYEY